MEKPEIKKPQTEKKTTRTGRRIRSKKGQVRISITINDADGAVSRLWELVKGICSRRKETAAETARRVMIRGLTAELEEITLATHSGKPDSGGGHPDLFP